MDKDLRRIVDKCINTIDDVYAKNLLSNVIRLLHERVVSASQRLAHAVRNEQHSLDNRGFYPYGCQRGIYAEYVSVLEWSKIMMSLDDVYSDDDTWLKSDDIDDIWYHHEPSYLDDPRM